MKRWSLLIISVIVTTVLTMGMPRDTVLLNRGWRFTLNDKIKDDNIKNLPAGSIVDLYTYTNADEVELRINGKLIGRKRNDKSDSKKRNRIKWERIPYRQGIIEAFAYNESPASDKAVVTHKIETTGEPKRLTATADNKEWKADGQDLQYVRIARDWKNRISARL